MAAETVNAKVQPPIATPGPIGFLLWARRDAPQLYAALAQRFPVVNTFENLFVSDSDSLGRCGDISDIFSSIGDAMGSAMSSIGSFVATNGADILKTGANLYTAQKQYQLANTQAQLALANRAPLQTAYVPPTQSTPGFMVPVQPSRIGANGAAPRLGPSTSIMSPLLGIPLWGWLAGGAGLLTVVLLSRKQT